MRALLPERAGAVDDEYLLDRYGASQRPFVRFNFVSSLDGSAQIQGLSAALGSDGDKRIFSLLRRLADVVLVGAGTVRAEGYEGALVSDEDRHWRTAHGLASDPVLGIVSHGLNLEPDAEVLTMSPAPVLLFTSHKLTPADHERFPAGVELIQVPEAHGGCDPQAIVDALVDRPLGFIHCEGGPRLFGQFIAAGLVDSACISFSPMLAAGPGSRIASADTEVPQQFTLHSLLEEDSMLFTDYRRP